MFFELAAGLRAPVGGSSEGEGALDSGAEEARFELSA